VGGVPSPLAGTNDTPAQGNRLGELESRKREQGAFGFMAPPQATPGPLCKLSALPLPSRPTALPLPPTSL